MAKGIDRWASGVTRNPAYEKARDDVRSRMEKSRIERERKIAAAAKILAKPKRK